MDFAHLYISHTNIDPFFRGSLWFVILKKNSKYRLEDSGIEPQIFWEL